MLEIAPGALRLELARAHHRERLVAQRAAAPPAVQRIEEEHEPGAGCARGQRSDGECASFPGHGRRFCIWRSHPIQGRYRRASCTLGVRIVGGGGGPAVSDAAWRREWPPVSTPLSSLDPRRGAGPNRLCSKLPSSAPGAGARTWCACSASSTAASSRPSATSTSRCSPSSASSHPRARVHARAVDDARRREHRRGGGRRRRAAATTRSRARRSRRASTSSSRSRSRSRSSTRASWSRWPARVRPRLMVGHLLLYHPAMVAVKQLCDAGELGDIYYLYSQRLNLGIIRSDENAWWSLAPHDLSVALLAVRRAAGERAGDGRDAICRRSSAIEDVVFASLRFADGRMAQIHVSWLDPHKMRKLTIVGVAEDAGVRRHAGRREAAHLRQGRGAAPGYTSYEEGVAVRAGQHHHPPRDHARAAAARVRRVPRLRASRDRAPRTDGRDGLDVVRVLAGRRALAASAAARWSRSETRVKVPLIDLKAQFASVEAEVRRAARRSVGVAALHPGAQGRASSRRELAALLRRRVRRRRLVGDRRAAAGAAWRSASGRATRW